MERPPRNLVKDRLLSAGLMVYSYCFVGTLEFVACLISLVITLRHYGLTMTDISFLDGGWSMSGNDPVTVNGITFSDAEQSHILKQINAAWFFNIVVCTWQCVFHNLNRCFERL